MGEIPQQRQSSGGVVTGLAGKALREKDLPCECDGGCLAPVVLSHRLPRSTQLLDEPARGEDAKP